MAAANFRGAWIVAIDWQDAAASGHAFSLIRRELIKDVFFPRRAIRFCSQHG